MSNHLRSGALLAINLLLLMVWGFAGFDKAQHGMPAWFEAKFSATILGRVPGVTASFWLLAAAELFGFGLALVALVRGDFLRRSTPVWLMAAATWSLWIFLQLAFGQWLLADFNATFQMFVYFGVTLMMLHFMTSPPPPR